MYVPEISWHFRKSMISWILLEQKFKTWYALSTPILPQIYLFWAVGCNLLSPSRPLQWEKLHAWVKLDSAFEDDIGRPLPDEESDEEEESVSEANIQIRAQHNGYHSESKKLLWFTSFTLRVITWSGSNLWIPLTGAWPLLEHHVHPIQRGYWFRLGLVLL